MFRPYLIKYKVVSDCIIYILYFILAYIQHNGESHLKIMFVVSKHFVTFPHVFKDFKQSVPYITNLQCLYAMSRTLTQQKSKHSTIKSCPF
jgi:hypothetical protein